MGNAIAYIPIDSVDGGMAIGLGVVAQYGVKLLRSARVGCCGY